MSAPASITVRNSGSNVTSAGVRRDSREWERTAADRMVAARDRLARLWDFYAFHQQLQAVGEPLRELAVGLQEVQRRWAELAAAPGEETLLAVERTVARVEREAVAVDARIPVWRFRRRLSERGLPADVMLRYAALLGRFLDGDDPVRRARIEQLAAEVLGLGESGDRKHVSFDEAQPLLATIASGRAAKPDVRARADSFFREQLARVMTANGVAEVLDDGLLLDLEGFKSTLAADLLDPAILHGVVTLDAAIRERLSFLAAAEGRPAGEVRYLYWKTELQLQRLLRRSRERRPADAPAHAPTKRVDWGRWKWRAGLAAKPRAAASKRLRLRPLALPLLAVVLGFALWSARPARQAPITTITPRRIAPEIATAAVADGALVATISPAVWNRMSAAERRGLAIAVRDALPSVGAKSARVRSEDTVVVQIEGGVTLVGGGER